MSDEHHEHDGGHELEALDAGQLFRLVGGLSVVVLISIIAVIQWFHKQQAELRVTRSDYSFIAAHHEREAEMLEGIDTVAKKVGEDPKLLAAPEAPAGWVHPDDIKGGAAPADDAPAGDAPGDRPAPPAEVPEGEEGAEGEDGAEEAPGGVPSGADDEAGGAEGDAPDDEKPAGEEKPADEDSADKGAKTDDAD